MTGPAINLAAYIFFFILLSCNKKNDTALPEHQKLAQQYFGEDAQWYLENIPFFECSDTTIEQVYYYRWKMYKAHIRSVGDNRWVITEFINHVPWDREPYCTINAASMHHIYEGRWLRDQRYMDAYINYLYQNGGNDRRYSESVADASYARFLVHVDSSFVIKQLDSMMGVYNQWADHWDAAKDMYYIPAMPDATEYTIASIDGSGGKAGFDGGEAFRPTINSYMYGNALAIAKIATMKGDSAVANDFFQKAVSLKKLVEENLWNDSLQHFIDRLKMNNEFVHYWDFIRGRELAGFAPWYFNLPSANQKFYTSWKHLMDTAQLLGRHGLRTNEPSYEYYFKQFVFADGKPGSQWNGPSWPYQTSQTITGMANLLNDYNQAIITNSDYLKILRLFARQHYLPDGKINLVENYDPNFGGPIVHYYWSNHYNHSSFNNLVISGLCGIRPSEDNTLTIHPLVDSSIHYFYLGDVNYHGHKLTVIYDEDGSRYGLGKGVTVFVDDKKAVMLHENSNYKVFIGPPVITQTTPLPVNDALNIAKKDFPVPSASVNSIPEALYQSIDGRIWYFTEITNYWNTLGSAAATDWFALDFGKPVEISSLKIYPFADDKNFAMPDSIAVEYEHNNKWMPVKLKVAARSKITGNTANTINFEKVGTAKARINFIHRDKQVAVSEVEFY